MNNISSSDKKAYAEIDYILHNMNPTYLHKVPTKLVDFFEEVMDQEHDVKIDSSIPLYENNLEEYTFEILNVLNLNYWCEDETRKEELLDIMKKSKADDKISNHLGEDIININKEYTFREIEKDDQEGTKEKEETKKTKVGFFRNILNIIKRKNILILLFLNIIIISLILSMVTKIEVKQMNIGIVKKEINTNVDIEKIWDSSRLIKQNIKNNNDNNNNNNVNNNGNNKRSRKPKKFR